MSRVKSVKNVEKTYVNFIVAVNYTVEAVHVRSIDVCQCEDRVTTGIKWVNDNSVTKLVGRVVEITCEMLAKISFGKYLILRTEIELHGEISWSRLNAVVSQTSCQRDILSVIRSARRNEHVFSAPLIHVKFVRVFVTSPSPRQVPSQIRLVVQQLPLRNCVRVTIKIHGVVKHYKYTWLVTTFG